MKIIQLVSYYGGKQTMIEHILPLIPQHGIYIEPFCGGATLFFAKQPSKLEIINDMNNNLITLYEVARHRKLREKLQQKIDCCLHSETIFNKTKAIYRNPKGYKKVEIAFATWYQCNFSFSNQPGGTFARDTFYRGAITTMVKSKKNNFEKAAERLENASILCEDAIASLKRTNQDNVFAYVDPPYFNSDCGHYSGYTQQDFVNLLNFLTTEFKGKFLLSSYQSEILSEYTAKYNLNTKIVEFRIRASGATGKTKKEVLTYNYEIEKEPSLF